MDANGTRYHLLLGQPDWGRCTADERGAQPLEPLWADDGIAEVVGVAWNEKLYELTLEPRIFEFVAAPADRPPQLENRRGAGRDYFGNWYWIDDPGTGILVNSAGDGVTSTFWTSTESWLPVPESAGDFQPKTLPESSVLPLRGLAVTADHYLVVGVLDPPGLLIFDLHGGGGPRQVRWPVVFAPFDMAPAPNGGLWILDRDHRRYWGLDRYLNVLRRDQEDVPRPPESFQPLSGPPASPPETPLFPRGISLEGASPLDLVGDPIAIEALPDGTVLVLDGDPTLTFSLIWRYDFAQPVGNPLSTESIRQRVEESARASFRLRTLDLAFVPDEEALPDSGVKGRLVVVATDGNQAFAFEVHEEGDQLSLTALAEYLPMRLFGGKGLVAAGGQVYYDFARRWIPLIEQRRPRYREKATIFSPLFDGDMQDCVWHRLLFDACIPPDAQVEVRSRAANSPDALLLADWQAEPLPYRRPTGSELPFTPLRYDGDFGTFELLFQRAEGRFLQLELQLSGNGRVTPSLRALRVYFPRFSYLTHYLPAVYREDPDSASFLDRFLANVEGLFTAIEDRVAAIQMLFDVRSVPSEWVDWLAGWFGIAFDLTWDEARRRLLIQHAIEFFNRRGTILGLQMALQLALSKCPSALIFSDPETAAQRSGIRIIERYRTRHTPGVVFGDPTDTGGGSTVLMQSRWGPDQGGSVLDQRYSAALAARKLIAKNTVLDFPGARPANPTFAAVWDAFVLQELGFVPVTTLEQPDHWRNFLARRYRFIDALNDSYGLIGADRYKHFDTVAWPVTLPPDGAPLHDWFQFQSVVLTMHQTAHLFTVLLPMPETLYLDLAAQAERRALAERIVALEKPAHTIFDVKFYWGMFRLGDVRLGYDTIVDLGSRAPQLNAPLVLGKAFTLESSLTASHPQDVANRRVEGRDALQ